MRSLDEVVAQSARPHIVVPIQCRDRYGDWGLVVQGTKFGKNILVLRENATLESKSFSLPCIFGFGGASRRSPLMNTSMVVRSIVRRKSKNAPSLFPRPPGARSHVSTWRSETTTSSPIPTKREERVSFVWGATNRCSYISSSHSNTGSTTVSRRKYTRASHNNPYATPRPKQNAFASTSIEVPITCLRS